MQHDEEMGIHGVYIVGGYVRDKFLGVKSKDIDYAVEADSFEAMEKWVGKYGRIFVSKPEYQTIRAFMAGEPRDFVLCRKDGPYSDKRRPDYTVPGTLLDDLARRDFTVNAMALDVNGGLIDPHNGEKDIKSRLLRCVNSPQVRFREDALRMLRAMRFHITKGFVLDKEIIDCLESDEFCDLLSSIAEERIREELTKCFQHSVQKTINFLHDYPKVMSACFAGNLWLLPTSKKN
uniref:Poly A polymerase head domain-containing protein n=1 Tax=viral metagenome TaxID=1070528 RepID=A0A6C0EPR2_9ZZZZ